MRVLVGFSVFAPEQAVGSVEGNLELECVPREGETVSFLFSNSGTVVPKDIDPLSFMLKVERVTHMPATHESRVMVSLADVVLKSPDDAEQVLAYFEAAFGLFANRHAGD